MNETGKENLESSDQIDENATISEVSSIKPEWFCANPECIFRLDAFILRELRALAHIINNRTISIFIKIWK